MKYLKTILIYSIISALSGALLCVLIAFMAWDIDILKQILIPIRMSTTLGVILGNVSYFVDKYYYPNT